MSERVQKINDQILAEAEKEANIISEQSEITVTEIEKTAQKEIEKIRTDIEDSGRNEIENQNKRVLGQARLNAKMDLLNARQAGLSEIFAKGRLKLTELSKLSEYSSVLTKLAVMAGNALGGGELILSVRKEDASKIQLDAIAKQITARSGVNSNLTIDNSISTNIGGVILRKSGIWVDNTFEAIIDRRQDGIRNKIAKILFS